VLAAPNAEAALVVCENHPIIDALLTDVRMPGSLDAMELAARSKT
jgi:CheY-like chemotaxis protein